jgi:importin subunit beta-1
MNWNELESCLYNALNPDSAIRKRTEEEILKMQTMDYNRFILGMMEMFRSSESNDQITMIAGIIIKNSLHANDRRLQRECEDRWFGLPLNTREAVKKALLELLDESVSRYTTMAGGILGQIARIEIPKNLYLEFFQEMHEHVSDENMTAGVLEALGLCCSYLIEETQASFNDFSELVFRTCIAPLKRDGGRRMSRVASLKCIMNSLEAMEPAFSSDENVTDFLTVITRAGLMDEELANKALMCLNRFVFLYLKMLTPMLDSIAQYMDRFFKAEDANLRIQTLEFWCTIAESKDMPVINKYFPLVLPDILASLRKDDDFSDEVWSPHKAAASCLELFTGALDSKVMRNEAVSDFVTGSLKSSNKADVDIGAVALGCVMSRGCEEYLVNVLPLLIGGIEFEESRDSCLWAISKTAEANFYAAANYLPTILNHCGSVVMENSASSVVAAWVMNCIFLSISDNREPGKGGAPLPEEARRRVNSSIEVFMTKQYLDILTTIVKATEVASYDDSNLRVALFAALSELTKICPPSHHQVLGEFYSYIKRRVDECLSVMSRATANQLLVIEDVLSNYIALIETIVSVQRPEKIGDLFLLFKRILDSTPTTAFGEVYIAISSLSEDFQPHLREILPYMERDLGCMDSFVLKSVINLVGTLANTAGNEFATASTNFIPPLVRCLSAELTPRELKPLILSVFGDIALGLEAGFEPYLDMVVMILHQIVSLDRSSDEVYIDELRKNMVQLLNCIVIALGDNEELKRVLPRVLSLFQQLATEDQMGECRGECVGFLDDLVAVYGKSFGLDEHWVRDYLYESLRLADDKTRYKADHALVNLR